MNTLPERFLDRQIEEAVHKMVTEAPVPPLEESWARLEQKRREQAPSQHRQPRLEPQPEQPLLEEVQVKQPQPEQRPRPLFFRWAAVAAAVLVVGGVLSFQGTGSMTTEMRTAGIAGNITLDKASAPAFTMQQPSSVKPAAPPPAADSPIVSDSSATVSESSVTPSENASAFTRQAAPVTAGPEPVDTTQRGSVRETVAAAKPSWMDIASLPKEERRIALAVPARGEDAPRLPAPAESKANMESAAAFAAPAALPVPADVTDSNAPDTSTVSITSITSAHNQPGPVVTYLPPGYTLLVSKQRETVEPAASTSLRYAGPAPHYFSLTVSAAPLPPEEGTIQAQRDVDIAGAPGKLALFAKGLLRIEWRRDKAFYTLTGILPEGEAVRIAQSVR
ncbi:hypothetical protein GTO91_16290 [Heliobacterium undosum]|uniref:DUF4367 domain-containing protein n=1 Tax=Heliomicrobium undosum TaxID=121734 RepID=A0A845L3Q1_9FIRM|nr:DUF4367 domain-containing protein [Heliomicrobium undosum]MZP31267.1 hypothetical protein [Heliomicrobium undosum]